MVNKISLRSLIWRGFGFLLIWVMLNTAAWHWGDHLGRAMIPLYKYSFSLLTEHYELKTLRIESRQEVYFANSVQTAGSRVINNKVVPNGAVITGHTLQGHLFQPIILALALLLIWPLQGPGVRWLALLLSLPVIALVVCLDVPIVLVGSLEDLILYNFHPEALRYSIPVQIMHFLNGGGRQLLGLLAAILSVILSYSLIALFLKVSHKNFIKRFRSLARLSSS